MKRLLLVAYEFPPKGGTQSQHAVKMAKSLAGWWEITVLTVKDPPAPIVDEAMLAEAEQHVDVIRAWSWEPTRLIQVLRRVRRGSAQASGSRGYSSLSPRAIRLVQSLFFPDEKIGWVGPAVAAAHRAHQQRPFDAMIATGPPYSGYVAALRIAKWLEIPWIADLRDPVVGQYFLSRRSPWHGRYLRKLEDRIVSSAGMVAAATEGMRAAIVARHPRAVDRIFVVPNGFDPDDFDGPAPESHNGFVISYVGAFQATVMPQVFLAAVKMAMASSREFADDVRIRFVGPVDPESELQVREAGLEGTVERVGFVPHDSAVMEMRSADVLLQVIPNDPALLLAVGSKLPEYLASGTVVFSMAPAEGDAAAIVTAAGGVVVEPDDTQAACAALLELHARWKRGEMPVANAGVVSRFNRSNIAVELNEMLSVVTSLDGESP